MNGIFVSYRRDDSAGYAGRLYDRMVKHFGADRVFMDVEGIEPGVDFVTAIEEAVGSCRVLIVIIGDEWITITDAAGRRRLDDPNDFIRLETGTALKRGIRVVPVLVGGAAMPRTDELPDELQSLTRRQAIEISHKQWDASTSELIRTLEKIMSNGNAPEPSPTRVSTQTAASSVPPGDGGRSKWLLPAAAAALALFGGALWYFVGQRGEPPVTKPPEVVAVVPRSATGMTSAPETVVKPAPAPKAESAPVAVPATPPAPLPTPVPSIAPVPAQKSAPTPPAATAVQAPQIREFKAEADATGARLCYQVSNADSVTLSPRPGELVKPDADCIRVDLDTATTFTLAARNAGRTVRKTLVVAPKPVEVARTTPAPATPAPATVVPPSVPPSAPPPVAAQAGPAAQPGLPHKGESWTYRSHGKWPTSPKRSFQIVVQSVADGVITDALRAIDPGSGASGEVRRSRGGKPDFVAWPDIGVEFSPYLGVYVEFARLESQSGFPTPDLDSQWTQWYSRLKWLGQESVSVPAGTYHAHKIEVWSNRPTTGTRIMASSEPVGIHYLVWYAPEAKRYVKMQRRLLAATGTELERDVFELVARRAL